MLICGLCVWLLISTLIFTLKGLIQVFWYVDHGDDGKPVGVNNSVNNSVKLALFYQQSITAAQWYIRNP